MAEPLDLSAHEQRIVWEILETLRTPADLSQMLGRAYALIARLVAVDHGALCVSSPSSPSGYDWAVAEIPGEFFENYHEIAAHDFVREAVLRSPNRVLRDAEMLSRPEILRSPMYQRCREFGMPIEHAMSVLFSVEPHWHGGLTLYRGRPRPFSARESAILQRLSPFLASAMHSSRIFFEQRQSIDVLLSLFSRRGAETLVLGLKGREIFRTHGMTRLLSEWFSPEELSSGALPKPLLERYTPAMASPLSMTAIKEPWTRTRESGITLSVSLIAFQEGTQALWALIFEEKALNRVHIPEAWAGRLSPRELQVVERVLRGWDNTLIAEDLGCSLGTIKKHLQHIFDALGLSSRAALIALASKLR